MKGKEIRMSKLILLLLFVFACSENGSIAQQAQLKMLQDLSGMNVDRMSYSYKVLLVNKQSGTVLDSVSGVLYRYKEYYLDSNRLIINIRDANYTLQINPGSRTAYVKSIKAIQEKAKVKTAVPNVLFDMQELLKRNITSFYAGKDNGGSTLIQVVFDEPDINEIEALITPDKKIAKLVIKIPAGGMGSNAELKVLTMFNFSDQFDPAVITTTRFMTVNKNICKLKGKFSVCLVQRLI